MTRRALALVAIVAVAALVVLVLLAYCRPKPAPIPRAEQKTLDSLEMTRAGYAGKRDTLIRVESVYVATSERQTASARQNATLARSSRSAADSIRARAIVAIGRAEAAADSSSLWHRVAILRGAEADSLRSGYDRLQHGYDSLSAAHTNDSAAVVAAQLRAANADRRLTASEDLNARLARVIREGDRCRIAFVLSCPTRKQAAVGGVIVAIAAVKYGPQFIKTVF